MARSIESPFLDAESFTGGNTQDWNRLASSPAYASEDDQVNALEQFEELRELWTPEGETLDAGGAAEEAAGAEDQSEAFEQEAGNTACTDSGYGIVGTVDDRRKVANTLDVPFRWICQIWARKTDSNGKVTETGGTGVLVSPRHVLTVAHLVREDKLDSRNQWIKQEATYIRVTPGRDGNGRPFGTHTVSLPAQISPHWDPRKMPHGQDYALLTLDNPIGDETFKTLGGKKLCYWGSQTCGAGSSFRRVPPESLNGRTAMTAGYPKDKGRETMYVTRGQIANAHVRSRTMNTNADACQGQSGSPIWLDVDNQHCLVGMMVAVGRGTNIALRVTDELCAQLRTWMKGASDACAPRAATSGTSRPQPELEGAAPARCRCAESRSVGELESRDIIDPDREDEAWVSSPPADDDLEAWREDESGVGEPISLGPLEVGSDLEDRGWDSEHDDSHEEAMLENRELDRVALDIAERTMVREAPEFEGERTSRFTRCFAAADADRVKKAYEDNAAAADANDGDRCSCIVMLNVALGQLLPLRLKQNRARGSSNRTVSMGALTTETIEKAMQQLRNNNLATAPTVMDFFDSRKRTAGTLKPERLKASVQDKVLSLSTPEGCWYAYGLSVMDGYHSVLLLVDRRTSSGKIYWLDQHSSGLNDEVTSTLDERITERTQRWWQGVKDSKQKGFNTTIRIWPLKKPAKTS